MARHWITLLPCALLAAALLEMPYGYYKLLRVAIFLASIFLATRSHKDGEEKWVWAFAALALIYNPIIPMPLGRPIWMCANLATTGVFAARWWLDRRAGKGGVQS
jgi:hypothetical protein